MRAGRDDDTIEGLAHPPTVVKSHDTSTCEHRSVDKYFAGERQQDHSNSHDSAARQQGTSRVIGDLQQQHFA
jgi:hypothetical protein